MCRQICLLVLLAGWTSGDSLFNAKLNYQPMDEFFEPRHRGHLFLPPCVKDLMNCWEVNNPDVLCKQNGTKPIMVVRFDTICMDLRYQCREYMGYQPFPNNRGNLSTLFTYCGTNSYAKQLPLKETQYWVKNDTITTTAKPAG
ncbi:uncharacterized protein LOC125241938 [Leguminivora glycinivorella]|uniref:uncharacterized protein LOC125241938 n=1 Tax=Leguminivora glycinivorella TaxID=1035111 RepID=UPI00200BE962|nr:uncharacterized protein LOC125241938 [Leguminivora glycinivorella]